jgi:hypothetical protein
VGTRPVFLLEVEYAGRLWLAAEIPVTVLDAAGAAYSYPGGLASPNFEQTLGRLSLDPGEATASVEVVFEGADIAHLRRQGHDLQRARATLWMVAVRDQDVAAGLPTALQTMEDRWWIIDGRLTEPHYSDPEMPAGFLAGTIQDDPWTGTSTGRAANLLTEADRLDDGDFPSLTTSSTGKYAPIVIGRPGWFPDDNGSWVGPPRATVAGGSPGYWADAGTAGWVAPVVICREPVAATQVIAYGSDPGNPEETRAVAMYKDANGRLWPAIELSGSSGLVANQGEYHISWFYDGGIFDPLSGGVLENAAAVAAWALLAGGLRIDRRRWIAAIDRLPVVTVAGYVNDPDIEAWPWVEDNILPLLPVTVARGQHGLRPIIYDPHLRTDEVRAHLTEGEDWNRIGRIQTAREVEDQDLTTAWNISHGMLPAASLQQVRADQDFDTDPTTQSSLYHRIALDRYGRPREVSETDRQFLWDRESAAAALRVKLRLQTMPLEVATYVAPWHVGWLDIGDAVAVTDSRAHWTAVVGIISAKSWEGASWRYEVTVDEDMIRDTRLVP